MRQIFILFLLFFSLQAQKFEVIDFDLYKITPDSVHKSQNLAKNPPDSAQDYLRADFSAPALLILSGIQGDEPGAFNATSIFIRHYRIKNGAVWVVPNLNQHSILKNHRGIYGDMNRKFADLAVNDPEYATIQRIKTLILDEGVGAILHLHDGSGFYRERYISALLNPHRWGNCSIIDQDTLFRKNDLNTRISAIIAHINDNLLDELHRYRIRNTHTAQGDSEQSKSLTYFATTHKKMAFASEASKSLLLDRRVYYHLLAIEGALMNFGIEFERDFALSLPKIRALINDKDANIDIEDIIKLPLQGIKSQLNYFPIPKKAQNLGENLQHSQNLASDSAKNNIAFNSNNPIIWLFKDGANYRIKNGNRALVALKPFFIDFDKSLEEVNLVVDGAEVRVKIGSVVKVARSFEVKNLPYRVNVIGYSGRGSEAGIEIKQSDLIGKFAINKANTKFRVEFYKADSAESMTDSATRTKNAEKFSGMIIMDFGE